MNKFLMGTTALVAASAFAAPAMSAERIQLTLRGFSTQGITYVDADRDGGYRYTDDGTTVQSGTFRPRSDDYNEINFGSSSEVHFIGSTTLDNGLEVTFHAELELEDDNDAALYYYEATDTIDEVYVQFDGGFGRVQFGQQDGVMDQTAVIAPSTFRGHSHNDMEDRRMDPFLPVGGRNYINTVGDLSGDHIKIIYFTPEMNGLQLGFSYTPNPCKNDTGYSQCVYDEYGRNYWEVAGTWQGSYNNVMFEFSGGYGQGEGWYYYDDPQEWTVGGNVGFGGFTIGGSYKDTNARRTWSGLDGAGLPSWRANEAGAYDENSWDVGISYESGPWGFNLAYGRMDAESRWGTSSNIIYDPSTDVSTDGIYHYEAEAESWIGGITYRYGPGMQFGVGVQTYERELARTGIPYDVWPGGSPTDGRTHSWEGFDGLAVFLENSIKF